MFDKIIKICAKSIALNVVFQLLFVVFIVVSYVKTNMGALIFWSILCGLNIAGLVMLIGVKIGCVVVKYDWEDKNDKKI